MRLRLHLRLPSHQHRSVGPHSVLLPVGIATMLLAVLGGLARLGMLGEHAPAAAVAWHGPLVLFGFLGVLVSVERAVALRRAWAFTAPLLGCAGTALLLAGVAIDLVAAAWTLAALVTGLAVAALDRRHASLATRCMLASCASWAVGVAAWGAGASIAALLPWWAAFLVLMILGERIQFGKLDHVPRTRPIVGVLASVLVGGALLAGALPAAGMAVSGGTLVVLGCWLLDADVSRRIRRPGLLWYVTVGLAAAYGWLVVTGVIWLLLAPTTGGLHHDAAIHALFQGFVMGMVFAHAPMIFPAVTGQRMPFHRVFHVPLALLHLALLARVGGDLLALPGVARWGSILSATALGAFVVVAAGSVLAGRLSAARGFATRRRATPAA